MKEAVEYVKLNVHMFSDLGVASVLRSIFLLF